jgi:GNAT superfamily N-acetyltransferase
MPESGVRLARTSDVDGIADVNVRSWRHRFTGILPDPVLAALDARDLAMVWASGILNPPTPGHRLLVAVEGPDVVGYAAIGPSQDPDAQPHSVELLALEVDPGREREGHGSRLVAAAVDHARAASADTVLVWCLLADEPRRAYLQSAGWGPDSAYRDLSVGWDDAGEEQVVREVRLVTGIDESGA